MNENLVFVDTETTGLDPDRHEIWEIALIYPHRGTWAEYERQIHVSLRNAEPGALRINRYYERFDGKRAFHAMEVAESIARLTAGKHLVGAVPDFDARFMEKMLRDAGYAPAWHYHLVDVESLAAGALRLEPPWKSDDLGRALGVPPSLEEERHTALGDARWAKRLYDAVMVAGVAPATE